MPYSLHRINIMATQACRDKISLFANLRCPVEANNNDDMSKHDILNSSITCISVTPSRIAQCLGALERNVILASGVPNPLHRQ